jgi:SAM-dependent methyltransferase
LRSIVGLVKLDAMDLVDEYKRQARWRPWPVVVRALPPITGRTILDLGCAVGDQAAELVAHGARVIGVDANEDLLGEARSRGLANADFRAADLRATLPVTEPVDGLWCSFAAAYFTDLPAALERWATHLRPGGWMALTEIDDLFGHEPLPDATKSVFAAYARDALAARRYDFHMGRKLRQYLERSGFAVSTVLTLEDDELSFTGPAQPAVLDAWRNRLDRMRRLHDFCGPRFDQVRAEFLDCLASAEHRSIAKVYCCIGTRQDAPIR